MMQGIGSHGSNPELRALVVEASLALARLDAERLEELADLCRAFDRDLGPSGGGEEYARQARDAAWEMAVFGRVLEATRANLEVVRRLRERRTALLEYGGARGWAEKGHGNH
jgi:hypothetical protein